MNTQQTSSTPKETTTASKTKAPSSTYYIAAVDYFYPPGEGSDTPTVEFVQAKTRTELSGLLADAKVNRIFGIFKGKQIKFALQRKIAF